MRKLIASLFAVALLAAPFAGNASANKGKDNTGSSGRFDNCTGGSNKSGKAMGNGPNFHACSS